MSLIINDFQIYFRYTSKNACAVYTCINIFFMITKTGYNYKNKHE